MTIFFVRPNVQAHLGSQYPQVQKIMTWECTGHAFSTHFQSKTSIGHKSVHCMSNVMLKTSLSFKINNGFNIGVIPCQAFQVGGSPWYLNSKSKAYACSHTSMKWHEKIWAWCDSEVIISSNSTGASPLLTIKIYTVYCNYCNSPIITIIFTS